MGRIKRWHERLWEKFQGMWLFAHLAYGTRRGLWLGMWVTGLTFLLLGMLFGGVNRQIVGAVIGAAAGALLGVLLGGLGGALVGKLTLPSQADVSLTIELADEQECYTPGQVIEGEIRIASQNMLKISGGEAYLLCRGIYVHHKDGQDAADDPDFMRTPHLYNVQRICSVPPRVLRPGASAAYAFQTEIPEDALPTHRGYACSVRWGLYATLNVSDTSHTRKYRELMVEAIPPTFNGTTFKSSQETNACQLTLTLPRVVCAERESIEGILRVSPLEDFEAVEVRVLLLRIESTHEGSGEIVYISTWDPDSGRFQARMQPGDEGTMYVWLEDEVDLGEDIHFSLAEPVTYRFRLNVPGQCRPTFSTNEGQVIWKVAGIVARDGWPDARVFHEVIVHTGASQQVLLEEVSPSP
ncbi:MAG: hypothetical protein U9R48_10405 [Chloroflexota bacterium]|nr:hypothetical protein [Chloroflexota bacterium]